MIKIYDRTDLADFSKITMGSLHDVADMKYNFYEKLNILNCDVLIKYKGDTEYTTLHLEIDEEQYSGKILMIELNRFRNINNRFSQIQCKVKYEKITTGYYSPESQLRFKAASLYVPQDISNYPVIILPHVRTTEYGNRQEGLEYEEIRIDPTEEVQSVLIRQSNEAQAKKDLWELKNKYIGSMIEPCDSIAYLEGQVDVLYKIIDLLVEKTGIDISEYSSILDAVNETSVLKLKTIDNLKSEIESNKGKIRKLQKGYYLKKNGG